MDEKMLGLGFYDPCAGKSWDEDRCVAIVISMLVIMVMTLWLPSPSNSIVIGSCSIAFFDEER